MMQHQDPAMRNFMRYVSLLGDWPTHAAVGLVLLGLAWRRGSKEWTRIFLAMLLAMMLAGVAGTADRTQTAFPGRARQCTRTHAWGGARFSSKYTLRFPSGHVGASTAFFRRFTYRAPARRPCVPPNPDSDRALTDVPRRPLSLRRRLRSGSRNLVRACRRALPVAANRKSAIGNRKLNGGEVRFELTIRE